MMTAPLARLNRSSPDSLWWNIAVFVGATVVLNGLIFGLGWNNSTGTGPRASFAPPDWVIGAVWTLLLFPLMAAARWRLNRHHPESARGRTTVLLVLCLTWPFYSLALGSLYGALIGNMLVIVWALFTVIRCWKVDRAAALLVLPVAAWVTFATFIVTAQLGWF